MTSPTTQQPDVATLVERMSTHRTLGGLPRTELEWLAKHGVFRHYDVGDVIAAKGEPISEMAIILSGSTETVFERGS